MSFTEWYEKVYGEQWNEDYAMLYSFASSLVDEYNFYCESNNVTPIWNG